MPQYQQPASRYGGDKSEPSQFRSGRSIRKDVSYVISRKGTHDLTKFNGGISEFKDWKRKFLDHLIVGTPKSETIIEALAKRQVPVTKAELTTSLLDGYIAWEVASELCTVTLTWLSTTISDDRYILCGGKGQEGNGFELWRNLHINYMRVRMTLFSEEGSRTSFDMASVRTRGVCSSTAPTGKKL